MNETLKEIIIKRAKRIVTYFALAGAVLLAYTILYFITIARS